MTRRSATNARYRKDNVGSTRKSASAAKPKRDAGEVTSSSTKKPAEKKGFFATLFGPSSGPVVTSPEMQKLRRYWWGFLGTALVLAFGMVWMQRMPWGKPWATPVLVLYALAMGGALYLEFGPIRKARAAAMAEAKSSKKSGKAAKHIAAPTASAPDPSGPLAWLSRLFGRTKSGGDGS